MEDQEQSREQLVAELAAMRRRVAALEAAETEHKQTEAELARSKAILQATIESLPLDFFAMGPDGRYMMQNAASRLHWGDAIGKRPEDAAGTRENLSIWLENNRRAFAGEKIDEEVELTHQGEKRVYHNVIAPIRENDRIAGILGINSDITERKRAELALKQAHEELEARVEARTAELVRVNEALAIFRRFVEAAQHGFAMARLDGEITYVNPAISRLLTEGRSEDIIGKNVSAFYSKEYIRRREEEIVPTVLREGHWQGEVTISYRSGSIILLQSSFLVRDEQGNPAYFATVFTDIMDRKRAEEALVESEAKYRQLIELTDTGYVILDAQGRVVDANDEYVRLSGHHALKEILGRSVVEWTASYDLARNAKEIAKCLEKGTVRQLEVDYVRPDGEITPIEINAGCVDTKQGRRILALHRDISERRQVQAALEREHRTRKHLLQSSDHERQLIAYEIHDGLAQYLAGSTMQFDVYSHLKETKPKDAAKAFDAGMTMLRQSLADARRLISGVRPPILDEEGIVAAVSHLVNEHKRQKGSKIEFHTEVKFDRLVPILENAVYRIAQEALTNACTHSNSKRVRLELLQRGDSLRIIVQDWGVGFDPDKVEENRFGLAGMRERARLLGGSISVESTPGQGTCLAVELPLMVRE
jgi:PAS domain S-box-containing protein